MKLVNLLLRLPGIYGAIAFLTARRVVVRGSSMTPTLSPGEYVLFDRLAFRSGRPQRGDVVLASRSDRRGLRIVKRVVGVPGDTVVIDGDRCWVNGSPRGDAEGEPTRSARVWTLGEDEWLLLGDAPYASTDAREFGPVGREHIHARAWLVYWPPGRVRVVGGEQPGGQA